MRATSAQGHSSVSARGKTKFKACCSRLVAPALDDQRRKASIIGRKTEMSGHWGANAALCNAISFLSGEPLATGTG